MVRRILAALLAAVALAACSADEPPVPRPTAPDPTSAPSAPAPGQSPTAQRGQHAVAAGDPAAVDAGMAVLDAGGNAVDAAVAAAFAVAVVEPYASGIGGGGAAVVVGPDGTAEAFDYREVVADNGVVPDSGTGVPGFVAGLGELHDAHGVLPWADVLAPAIRLAREGDPASEMLAVRLREDVGPRIAAAHPQFAPGGRPLAAGELLVQEELAATMETIAGEGPDSLYTGSLAGALTAVPGLDAGSLAGYAVVRGEPVRGAVGEHEVLGAVPPLPGAPFVQMLQVAHALGAGDVEPGSAQFVDAVSRAWQVADRTTTEQLGDPAFVDVPVDAMTDPARSADLAQEVAGPGPQAVGDGEAAVSAAGTGAGNTTHVSVVDGEGRVVSMTNTLTHWFGSATYVAGFFLNDQLTRFDSIDTPANTPAPGRRSVSWSLPSVVVDGEGSPVLVVGSPGGRFIPNILATVYFRWAGGQPLPDAVAAPRFHAEGTTLQVEALPAEEVAAELEQLGYGFEVLPASQYAFGSVQALARDPATGAVTGARDTRREAAFAVAGP